MKSATTFQSQPREGVAPDGATLSHRRGWFNVALGPGERAIPRALARLIDFGVVALDMVAARRTQRIDDEANRPVTFSLTINRPPTEVYAFYRRLSQLPLFMDWLAFVREADSKYSHWVARLPRGGTIAWDAKITEDRPGEAIAWQSVVGSLVDMRGRVTFAGAHGRNRTEVRVELRLGFRNTRASASVAKFFTSAQVEGDLLRLKQLLETGDVLPSDASVQRRPPPAPRPASLRRAPAHVAVHPVHRR